MNIVNTNQKQYEYFRTHMTLDAEFRIQQLTKLRDIVKENEARFMEALKQDLGKSQFESYTTEIGLFYEEINLMIKKTRKWSKPKRVRTPMAHFLSSSKIHYQPYGKVLIISPWNYPFQLALIPLAGAIAAGNVVTLKPSRNSKYTTKLLVEVINNNFDEGFIKIVDPNFVSNAELLDQSYDYIFFTGSESVGKQIMEIASKTLTPITLELGGKSPCIVDKSSDIKLAAKRIVWGKLLNAGQTCVAPDHIIVQTDIKNQLIEEMKLWITNFYGKSPIENPEYPKIINQKHFTRLANLIKGNVVFGGKTDKLLGKIEPTIIDNVTFDDDIMQEEIFGPIMPIITFTDIDELINHISKKKSPLALYLFSEDKEIQQKVLTRLSFGGGCINDVVIHVSSNALPFGGVGSSGMGSYHGYESFQTFSHKKSIIHKSNKLDFNIRYAPFGDKLKIVKKILK